MDLMEASSLENTLNHKIIRIHFLIKKKKLKILKMQFKMNIELVFRLQDFQ